MGTSAAISGVIAAVLDPRQVTDGTGPISVPGLKVGDRLIAMCDGNGLNKIGNIDQFESVITIDDEIQQTGFGTGTLGLHLLFLRGG